MLDLQIFDIRERDTFVSDAVDTFSYKKKERA